MAGWHTFGLWWKPDEYVFFVDGEETWRTNAGGVSQVPEFMKTQRRDRQMGWRHQGGQAA